MRDQGTSDFNNIEYREACPKKITGHGTLFRKTWIGKLAEYVIVEFVRTGFTKEGVQVRIPTHITDRLEIDYSVFGKPGEKFAKQYKLVAEIQHIGGSTQFNGHYVAYSKMNYGWTKFNDERITPEDPWKPSNVS